MRVVAQLEGLDAFKIFENMRTALAKTMVSSGNLDPNKTKVKRFEDGSFEWIFEFPDEQKAKAYYNWLNETVTALKDFFGFSKVEQRNIKGIPVTIVMIPTLTGREEFPAAFWAKGNKLYWLESGHNPEAFEELLFSELSS
ncbi:hypothetical protein IPA_00850 [Ignicoccus pacificus DSM 13166]|uniref:Uncharacterized protein n=1 Tax=Ignicoccus pacificus DSM 13166 TaxID=940294 RepID=A0A977KAG7_9CREN|nr:hypothetical protein IPA_00850 [Ignicoccus pacificus DSM 13166]